MKTPVSVATNVAYAIPGAIIVAQGSFVSIVVGLAFIGLAIGSAAFHAWYSIAAQLADERGMYVSFGALAGLAWMPVVPDALATTVFVLGVLVGIVLAYFAPRPGVDSSKVMPALAITGILGIGLSTDWMTAALFLVGFLSIAAWRELPESNFWKSRPAFKDAYDLVHGIWHLGTALMMWLMWQVASGVAMS